MTIFFSTEAWEKKAHRSISDRIPEKHIEPEGREMIKENLELVESSIRAACAAAGRDRKHLYRARG